MQERYSHRSSSRVLIIGCMLLFLTACASTSKLDLTFDNSPEVTPFYDEYWVLKEDLVFRMKRCFEPCLDVEIVVPAGFVSDLASIPIPANIIFSKTGRYAPAGIVHDYLYWAQPCASRETADRIIKEALKASDRKEKELAEEKGESLSGIYNMRRYLVRNTIKLGVYIGGWRSWANNKQSRDEHVRSVKLEFRDLILPGERWEVVEKNKKYGEKLKYVAKQEEAERNGQILEEPEYCGIFSNDKRRWHSNTKPANGISCQLRDTYCDKYYN